METDLFTKSVVSFADIAVCVAIFLLVIMPRFNNWSEDEQGQYSGKPRDYIHDRVFRKFAGLYFLTYLVIAFVISQVPGLHELFIKSTDSVLGKNETIQDTLKLAETLGQPLLSPYLIMFIVLLKVVAPIAKVDERWRTFLLNTARVPKEVLGLKLQLRDGLLALDLNQRYLDASINTLGERGAQQFWDRVARSAELVEATACAGRMLVKCVYLLKFNQEFDNQFPCTRDLQQIETRLFEIAGVLPVMDANENARDVQKYLTELDSLQDQLVEMLARNCVKTYPDGRQRSAAVTRHGLSLRFSDKKEMDLQLPTALVFFGTFLLTLVSVALFLWLFDLLNVYTPQKPWFTMERLRGWSLGGGVSYVLAVGVGLYMNEALRNRYGNRNLGTYIMAFLLASVGSMIFFTLSREQFQPPFLFLSMNFGLMALVVIRSRGRGLIPQQVLLRKATMIALQYALVSGLLQCMMRVAFRLSHGTQFMELVPDMPIFFLFGAVRGGAVAFLVAYIFMDSERAFLQAARRKVPRIRIGNPVPAEMAGTSLEVTVVDLSEKGARLRVAKPKHLHVGDSIALLFSFGRMEGRVMSATGHQVRVCFEANGSANTGIQHYIYDEMGLAA